MAHVIRNRAAVSNIKSSPLKSVIDVKHSTYLDGRDEGATFDGRYFLGGTYKNPNEWDFVVGKVIGDESVKILPDGAVAANLFFLSISNTGKYFFGGLGDYESGSPIKLDAIKIYTKKREMKFYDESVELLTKIELKDNMRELMNTFIYTIMEDEEGLLSEVEGELLNELIESFNENRENEEDEFEEERDI